MHFKSCHISYLFLFLFFKHLLSAPYRDACCLHMLNWLSKMTTLIHILHDWWNGLYLQSSVFSLHSTVVQWASSPRKKGPAISVSYSKSSQFFQNKCNNKRLQSNGKLSSCDADSCTQLNFVWKAATLKEIRSMSISFNYSNIYFSS